MAILHKEFFNNNFQVGEFVKYTVESVDGEVVIDAVLPHDKKLHFMYRLWRSTTNGRVQSFEEFELTQFVLLQRKKGKLVCKVIIKRPF